MLTRILIYCILYPLSLLPLSCLYKLSTVVKIVVCDWIGYRKNVVKTNLHNSFPEKSEEELLLIEKQYRTHLCHQFVEGVKMLTLSKEKVLKHYHCKNPELVNQYFDKGQSVVLMSSHYNNWEWMVLSLALQFKHHGIGVGKANTNKVFEKLVNRARTRYGTEVVFADTVRETFEKYEQEHRPCVYMMLCDQSPANVNKSYITTFLHQPSAMIYGAEYFAKKYHYPVLYYVVKQPKTGYYEIEIEPISENAFEEPYGKVIEEYVTRLQRDITLQPPYWLWSHRRWKLHIPADKMPSSQK